MADFPFWVLVPIVAIIAWTIVTVTNSRARQHGSSRDLAQRVEELERRIDSIDKRS